LHPEAIVAMRRKIASLLAEAEVRANVPSWDNQLARPLEQQVSKDLGEWITWRDVYSILYTQIAEALGAREDPKSGKLSTLLGAEGLKKLVDAVEVEFVAIPRTYVVYFPLPNIQLAKDLALTPDIAFKVVKQNKNAFAGLMQPIRGLDFSHLGEVPLTYLSVTARGFVSSYWGQSALREASATVRRVFQVAVLRRTLATFTPYRRAASGGLLGMFGYGDADNLDAVACLSTNPSVPVARVSIDANMASQLRLYTNAEFDEERQEELLGALSPIVTALTKEPADDNTKPVRSALEWAFDSASDSDPALSFVKTCIALEAVLGDEKEKEGITDRLADRCAYLLTNTASDRKRTREDMKAIYDLRSKIVHGIQRHLANAHEDLRRRASIYLDNILTVEMQHVEAWHLRNLHAK
jgi:hypothetical protein